MGGDQDFEEMAKEECALRETLEYSLEEHQYFRDHERESLSLPP